MSAIPEDFIKKTAELSEEVTRPFPNSTKVYVQGSRPVPQFDQGLRAGIASGYSRAHA